MRAAGLAIVLLVALAAPRGARADGCAIAGTLSDVVVTVRRERGLERVRLDAPTAVHVTLLRPGIAEVRTDDGAIVGTTRAALVFAIARATTLGEGVLELAPGTIVTRATPAALGAWIEADVALGEGVFLRRAPIACDALAVSSAAPEHPAAAATASSLAGPAWRSRSRRLYLRDREDGEDALRLEVAPESAARFVELERRVAWVRVALDTSAGAHVRAWVRDEALVR